MQRHTNVVAKFEEKEACSRVKEEELRSEMSERVAWLQDKLASQEKHKSILNQKNREEVLRIKEEELIKQEEIQTQLTSLERENNRLQREIKQIIERNSNSSHNVSPCRLKETSSAQEEGEDSEADPSKPLPLAELLAMPMDDLLCNKNIQEDPTTIINDLKMKLTESEKKIEHLTGVVQENTESVFLLTEQAKVLKAEIRKLDAQSKGQEEIPMLEYLKNVFMQFVCAKSGDERTRLVPILSSILNLNVKEKEKIMEVADGDSQSSDMWSWLI